jgi:hypothetical protein
MSDLDVVGFLDASTPQGPDRAADTGLTTVGSVYAVDEPGRQVQVAVRGSVMWLPAMPGRYLVTSAATGGLARVLLNPITGRPVLVLGPLNPRYPAEAGTLTAINTGTHVATVNLNAGSYALPYLAATYTVGNPVWVGLSDWGTPYLVLGPSDVSAAPVTPPTPPAGPTTVQTTTTIYPQWSGSYRYGSGWDRWNTSRYGGRSTLYQGNGFGSGPMVGLATYGDQFRNLGAISIDAASVMLRGVGLSGASGPATVQGTPDASQPGGAPSPSGTSATGDGWTGLPGGILAGFLSGAYKGLCTVGGNYWAGNGDGMAVSVTYTRPA